MQMMIDNGRFGNVRILKPASVANMQANDWTYNDAAKNGDNYFGLFLSWGLGMQRFTDAAGGDQVIAPGGCKGFGHLGDAYVLYSGFIYDPITRDGLIGDYSIFYKWEEDILTALHRRAVAHDATPLLAKRRGNRCRERKDKS